MRNSVTFIRHAESTHNAAHLRGEDLRDGTIDAPLSPNGRHQATNLRASLGMPDVQVVLTSQLSRAIETAMILFPTNKTRILATETLRELRTHPCDVPRHVRELVTQYPRVDFSLLEMEEGTHRFPSQTEFSPEPNLHLHKRCRDFLTLLLKDQRLATVVVGHSTYFEALLAIQMGNCELTTVPVAELETRRLHIEASHAIAPAKK